MKADEVLEYMKEFKSDFKSSLKDINDRIKEEAANIKELTIEFRNHSDSDKPFRFKTGRNEEHIKGMKHDMKNLSDHVIEFMNGINSNKKDIKLLEDKFKKNYSSNNIILNLIIKHPRIFAALFSIIIAGLTVAESPFKHFFK